MRQILLGAALFLTSLAAFGQSEDLLRRLEQFRRAQQQPGQTPVTSPGQTIQTPTLPKQVTDPNGVKMVLVPAGEFMMGSQQGLRRDQQPAHTVYLDAFYMDVYEVANAQYRKFLEANPEWRKDQIDRKYHDGNYLKNWKGLEYPEGQDNYPVTYVSWYAAQAYAEWAGKQLPTEAQWEKAARGGLAEQVYPWGNTISHARVNYMGKSDKDLWNEIAPVGQFEPNGYGLYDMAGNVWEWCFDVYQYNFYAQSPAENPVNAPLPASDPTASSRMQHGKATNSAAVGAALELRKNSVNIPPFASDFVISARVQRGGAWNSAAMDVGVAIRGRSAPTHTSSSCGFRCVQAIPKPEAETTQETPLPGPLQELPSPPGAK